MADPLAEARRAYDEHRWEDAIRAYEAAEKRSSLSGDDLERMAHATLWGAPSHRGSWLDALERAEAAYVEEGDQRGATRMAIELAVRHHELLSPTVAAACAQRAWGYLASLEECAEHGLAQWALGFGFAFSGEFDEARSVAEMALDVGRRTGNGDVQGLALVLLGHVSVAGARREEALALLDQAAGTAMSGMVTPGWTGFIYCATIRSYRGMADWGRATEWSDVATRWCERESVAAWAGACRSARAEITRLHGRLEEAEAEARIACEELLAQNPLLARGAFNELGEVLLRRGDLAGAEEAFGRAIGLGSDAQPGLARLQLAQGKADAALRGLARVLDDTASAESLLARENRPFLLPVHVAAAIAAGDLTNARGSVAELVKLAQALGTEAPQAATAVARGELAVAEGAHDAAVSNLREGVQRWCDLDAPYEAAQARILLAAAYEAEGDTEAARLELTAARATFAEIGASRDEQQAAELLGEPRHRAAVATSRTFVFTDVVGSSRLIDALGDEAWRQLLTWHDRTLRTAFEAHSGEEIKHEGDGFFVAFADADAAITCACDIQKALDQHRREHGFAPQVRIGIHSGDAERVHGDYIGKAVHETARIADAAEAGAILASAVALTACGGRHKAGEHRIIELRGWSEPVEVAAVDWT
jgi:class 3 adenylate cyclase